MVVLLERSLGEITTPTDKRKMFKDMLLKRIVKENHARPINQLAFNPDRKNIVATCGGGQINIYDNQNRPNLYDDDNENGHIDLMLHWNGFDMYEDPEKVKEQSLKNNISSCSWVSVDYEDCILVFGGDDKKVRLLSVALSSEIHTLEGHNSKISYVKAMEGKTGVFCSLSKNENSVRLWHLCSRTKVCSVGIYKINKPCVAEFISYNNGMQVETYVIVGCDDGKFYKLPINNKSCTASLLDTKKNNEICLSTRHSKTIDSIKQLNSGMILSKSSDGKVILWDCHTDEEISTILKASMYCSLSPFAVSSDSSFFCYGNEDGQVYVHDISGRLICSVKHPRVKKMQITSCSFTEDSSQIVCTTEKSFIFRFDYISPEIRALWDSRQKDNDNDNESSDSD